MSADSDLEVLNLSLQLQINFNDHFWFMCGIKVTTL